MSRKMFSVGSFEEDLAKGMEQKLVARQTENQFSFDKIAKAVDFLNAASEIFDDTGFHAEAEVLTRMLERIAANGLKKKTNNVKQASKWEDLSKEEQEFYHALPADVKRQLKGSTTLRTDDPEMDYDDFINNIKFHHQQHKLKKRQEQNPQVLEFESLMPQDSDITAVPGSDTLEFESTAPGSEERAEAARLMELMEPSKKKV